MYDWYSIIFSVFQTHLEIIGDSPSSQCNDAQQDVQLCPIRKDIFRSKPAFSRFLEILDVDHCTCGFKNFAALS